MSTFSLLRSENSLIIKVGDQQIAISPQDALTLAERLQRSAEAILHSEKQAG